jgi:transcriptional regulator NrdR family protein
MKCTFCAAWTSVLETRETDSGHTLRRTRQCGNQHRFQTYEVLPPIYKRDPRTVRQTRVAAQVRAATWRRDVEIAKRVKTESHAAVAESMGLARATITKAVKRYNTVKAKP